MISLAGNVCQSCNGRTAERRLEHVLCVKVVGLFTQSYVGPHNWTLTPSEGFSASLQLIPCFCSIYQPLRINKRHRERGRERAVQGLDPQPPGLCFDYRSMDLNEYAVQKGFTAQST